MCLWDLYNSGEIFVFWEPERKVLKMQDACISVVLSNWSQEVKAVLSDRIFTRWICKLDVLLLDDWNLFSPCYLHARQPVLHYPCSYYKIVKLYFVYVCLQLCLVWSVVFILWYRSYSIWISTVFFFGSLHYHHCVITSQVPVCYPVNILSGSGYNLKMFRLSKTNVLFAVSSLTKVILIKVYRVCCITICPTSSPPVDN